MTDSFSNVYDDGRRADAYDELEFPGTCYLAVRDLPALIAPHARGARALDFGCGAYRSCRSCRYLAGLGFDVIGVDVAEPMPARARGRDPDGDYRRVGAGDLRAIAEERFDLVLSAFTLDDIPTDGPPSPRGSFRRTRRPRPMTWCASSCSTSPTGARWRTCCAPTRPIGWRTATPRSPPVRSTGPSAAPRSPRRR